VESLGVNHWVHITLRVCGNLPPMGRTPDIAPAALLLAVVGLAACGPAGQGGKPVEADAVGSDAGVTSAAEAGEPAEEIPNVPFSMFGGTPMHQNRAQVAGPAERPEEIASFRLGARAFASPVIGPDGTVYIGSLDGTFNALKRDGSLRWSYVCGEPVFASAAVSATGVVYVGCDDDTLLAFAADGSPRWIYRMSQDVDSAPIIGDDGVVYVGGEGLHAISSAGNRRWMLVCGHISGSPALRADGLVVVGSHDHRVYAVSKDGTVQWAFGTRGKVEGTPAVLPGDEVIVGSSDGNLYRLAAKGGMLWKLDTGGPVLGGAALSADGRVAYVGSMSGAVLAVDVAKGKILWRLETGGPVRATPLLDSAGRLYVGSRDHHLYAVDAGSGEVVWRVDLGAQIDSSVAIAAGGTIIVGDDQGVVHFLRERT